jgi:hypothetical protein
MRYYQALVVFAFIGVLLGDLDSCATKQVC